MAATSMVHEVGSLTWWDQCRGLKSCKIVFLQALLLHLFRHFCRGMYHLATKHSVTDRQRDRQTDRQVTLWCQYPIILCVAKNQQIPRTYQPLATKTNKATISSMHLESEESALKRWSKLNTDLLSFFHEVPIFHPQLVLYTFINVHHNFITIHLQCICRETAACKFTKTVKISFKAVLKSVLCHKCTERTEKKRQKTTEMF